MESLTRLYVRIRELNKRLSKGQTTEYALIMSAVAVVVFVTYQVMGQNVKILTNKINTDLTLAS